LEHKEFLAEAAGDPRVALMEHMLAEIGNKGSIVVYNAGFEKGRLNEIARDFPAFEPVINQLKARIVYLMDPFQQKFYYTPEMKGSYSIKKVLPALVPAFSYAGLEINQGGDASLAFEQLLNETSSWKKKSIRKNLLAYCELDTLAMVKILEVLENI